MANKIELPIEDIDSLENAKSDATDVSDFISLLFGNELEEAIFPLSTAVDVNTVADWYLHPELFELTKAEFVVEIPAGNWYAHVPVYFQKEYGWLPNFTTEQSSALQMTEADADKIVVGLGGENGVLHARKVKLETE